MAYLAALWVLLGLKVAAELQLHDNTFKPDYVLRVTAKDALLNSVMRNTVMVSESIPGPTIYLKEGRTTWIRVYNDIDEQNLTMHWHGLSQRTAPFSDGVPLVSQWPIPPDHFFDYEIRPEPGDAGTYYYHSHVGIQMLTAHGALIVLDEQRPVYQHEDITLVMADFYPKDDHTIEDGLLADPFKWSGEPEAVSMQGKYGNRSFGDASDPTSAPHVIYVEPDKTYRLRVIGATAISLVKIGIEDHSSFEVIEADGSYTTRVAVDHIQVAPGQRFSFLFSTKKAEEVMRKSQYWIRYETRERPTSIAGYALLQYRRSPCEQERLPRSLPDTPPIILPQSTNDYLEYALQPASETTRQKFPRLASVTRTVTIHVNQKLTSGEYLNRSGLEWVQNGHSWKEDVQAERNQIPYLIDAFNNNKTSNYTLALQNGGFDPSSRTFPAKVGEVVDIVWQNNGGFTGKFEYHPMHIHGEHAWDLGSGNGTYNATENEKRFGNFTPAQRDTTILPRYTVQGMPNATAGWRAWRIRITEENIGVWIMHCHIAQHTVMGMNTVWAFGDAASILRKFSAVPYREGYLDFGGSAYGSRSNDPTVNHFFPPDNLTNAGPPTTSSRANATRCPPTTCIGGATPCVVTASAPTQRVPGAITILWSPLRLMIAFVRQAMTKSVARKEL